ncbi:MAG TPA: hypothetical protein VF538_05485 [Pyrinomonadaceae bacterium]|jgi:hypothetical protein
MQLAGSRSIPASDCFVNMKVTHSAITSSVFELVKTVEVDVQLGDDSWSTRVELLRDTEKADHFRCHVWELELHRLIPSFPRDDNDQPAHITDAPIFVERGIAHSRVKYPFEDIIAPDVDSALGIVVKDLKRFLEHATGEEAK